MNIEVGSLWLFKGHGSVQPSPIYKVVRKDVGAGFVSMQWVSDHDGRLKTAYYHPDVLKAGFFVPAILENE